MGRVLALIPGHNEEELLPGALLALEAQTAAIWRVVVVSDNSTDAPAQIAAGWGGGVSLFESAGNRNRKAGALNQALAAFLPWLDDDDDWVLVMDADSRIVPGFVERALEVASASPSVGAVGGVFLAEAEHGILERLQALEYVRYAREVARKRGKARVLTGTATFARVSALRAVMAARIAGRLPGRTGIYHPGALCEDFELTLALKHLGYTCVSPKECLVLTELMPTLGMLWRQRTRWQRGVLQCLRFYGLTRRTAPYLQQQVGLTAGMLAALLLLFVTFWSLNTGTLQFQPLWAALGLIFWSEQLASAWRGGRSGRLLAACMLPDLVYDQ
ncbi:MAG: glycosyltransferase family 2 protein [Thermomicrobiales bacterium]